MRMWTKVLVEDDCNYYFGDTNPNRKELKNTAQHVDAFYFMGPRDMNDFFSKSGHRRLLLELKYISPANLHGYGFPRILLNQQHRVGQGSKR